MRIIRGKYKARRFTPPKGFPSRPTTDYAKEGLFNLLEHRVSLFDLDILDLCAGTGNISMELLSREAGNVYSVDKDPICTRHLYKLKSEIGAGNEWLINKSDIQAFVSRTDMTFDIIFCDPPYEFKFYREVIQYINDRKLLNSEGMMIIEHGKQTDLSDFSNFIEVRNFGNVYFSFFKPFE